MSKKKPNNRFLTEKEVEEIMMNSESDLSEMDSDSSDDSDAAYEDEEVNLCAPPVNTAVVSNVSNTLDTNLNEMEFIFDPTNADSYQFIDHELSGVQLLTPLMPLSNTSESSLDQIASFSPNPIASSSPNSLASSSPNSLALSSPNPLASSSPNPIASSSPIQLEVMGNTSMTNILNVSSPTTTPDNRTTDTTSSNSTIASQNVKTNKTRMTRVQTRTQKESGPTAQDESEKENQTSVANQTQSTNSSLPQIVGARRRGRPRKPATVENSTTTIDTVAQSKTQNKIETNRGFVLTQLVPVSLDGADFTLQPLSSHVGNSDSNSDSNNTVTSIPLVNVTNLPIDDSDSTRTQRRSRGRPRRLNPSTSTSTSVSQKQPKVKKNVAKDTYPYSNFIDNWNYDDDEFYEPNIFPFEGNPGITDPFLFTTESSAFDFFSHFIGEDLVQIFVNETNRYATQVLNVLTKDQTIELPIQSRLRMWKDTTVPEMYQFLAINFLMAHAKKNSIRNYWSTNELDETPMFSRIMPRDRYILILKMFHLNDNNFQKRDDRLYKIAPLLEHMLQKFQSTYYPEKQVCIDESIIKWNGRLSFKQYIPSKRHRFGVKLFVLCDSITGYVLNCKIYTGQVEEDENESDPISMRTVMQLMSPYLNNGHALYVDNYYTSPRLFQELYDKKTNACGTARANRKGLPVFPNLKEKGESSVRTLDVPDFGKFVAIKWHDKRDVHMLSSMHDSSFANTGKTDRKTNKLIQKPTCVLDYNKHMGLVDKSDMILSFNDTARKTLKWYKKVAFHFMDLMFYNSFILYSKVRHEENRLPFSVYRLKVIAQILEKFGLHRKRKKEFKKSGTLQQDHLRLYGRHFPSTIQVENEDTAKRLKQRKCVVHTKTKKRAPKRKDTSYECSDCRVPLCLTPCFKIYHTEQNF